MQLCFYLLIYEVFKGNKFICSKCSFSRLFDIENDYRGIGVIELNCFFITVIENFNFFCMNSCFRLE